MRRYRHRWPGLAFACAVAAWSTTWAAEPANSTDEAIYRARFDAMVQGHAEDYAPLEPVPGAPQAALLPLAPAPDIAAVSMEAAIAYAQGNNSTAFLVWRDGALQTQAYFAGTRIDTALVSKSLAKPLTAIVIGRAIALGAVRSLDQPVSDFITEWRGTPKAGILIRHLLDMRAGFLGQRSTWDPNDIELRAYLSPHHDDILVHDYPLTHTPGTRFDYANAVGDLVAIVIERATGERYARFVSSQVLQPMGAAGGTIWLDRPGGLAHSACCIMLPAQTWLRLALLLLDDGTAGGRRLLPPGYVAEMLRATPQNPFYGLGIYVAGRYAQRRGFGNPDMPGPRVLQSEPYLACDLYLFDGNADQVVYVVPSQRLIILRMGGPPPKFPEWDNAVLPNTILRGLMPRAGAAAPPAGCAAAPTPKDMAHG